MVANLAVLGLSIRCGVHTGEVERRGDDVGGVGVNLAARVMAAAAADEVWTSATVPGLSVGSGIRFEERGAPHLKGFEGEHHLYAAIAPASNLLR